MKLSISNIGVNEFRRKWCWCLEMPFTSPFCQAQRARCFGLLLHTLTDIAVQEQMICFIQYLDEKATKHTKFLLTTNMLSGESSSANAPTIKAALLRGLADKSLDNRKFASVCTDGASVMTGDQNGLAGLLRREFPMILTCICHRLALATVDTSTEEDMKYIDNVHNCLRQVWQFLENSPKKMATFIKIQANVNKVHLSGKGEKAVATKLQKAGWALMLQWNLLRSAFTSSS